MTKADKINAFIQDGKTVLVSTYTRTTKIKKTYKAVQHWLDRDVNFFKMEGEALLMIEGYKDIDTPKWVRADGCRIVIQG